MLPFIISTTCVTTKGVESDAPASMFCTPTLSHDTVRIKDGRHVTAQASPAYLVFRLDLDERVINTDVPWNSCWPGVTLGTETRITVAEQM